jgi:putative hydrolase
MHVHSTFSDGAATIEQNVRRAEELGLDRLTLVDHVRTDTTWVPEYVAEVNRLRQTTAVALLIAVEAKILTCQGDLDVPENLNGVDRIYAADHQVPGLVGPEHPRLVQERLRDNACHASDITQAVVSGTVSAMRRNHGVLVLAHLFSILPKVGLSEDDVTDEQIDFIAEVAADTRTTIEISERWRCPAARSVRRFRDAGVSIVVSTDSHDLTTLGIYDSCRATWSAVANTPTALR